MKVEYLNMNISTAFLNSQSLFLLILQIFALFHTTGNTFLNSHTQAKAWILVFHCYHSHKLKWGIKPGK